MAPARSRHGDACMRRTLPAVALVLLSSLAAAQTPPLGAGHGLAARMDRLAILLDLTDSQKAQVQQVLEEEHAKSRALFQQQKASGVTPTPDQWKASHAQLHQETLTRVHALLSDDQFKKFQVLSQPNAGHHWHGAGHGAAASGASTGS
jgi:hypothetical protein